MLDRPIRAFDGFRELIDILRLDDSLQVVFQNFREIIYTLLSLRLGSMNASEAYSAIQSPGNILGFLPNQVGYHIYPDLALTFRLEF